MSTLSSCYYLRGWPLPLLIALLIGNTCCPEQPDVILIGVASEGAAAEKRLKDDRCPTLEEVQQRSKLISDVPVDVLRAQGEMPPDCFCDVFPDETKPRRGPRSRGFAEQNYSWAAPGLSHKPFYFEDVALERFGQARLGQPAISGIKFFTTVPILPYKIGLDPPHEDIYTLGYERPGNRAPAVSERLPFSLPGAAMEAGVLGGFVLLFP